MRGSLSTIPVEVTSGLAVLVLVAGCEALFDESLVDEARMQNAVCDGRQPPERPDVPDGPDVGGPYHFVAHEMDVNTEVSWREIGLNLDGLCSGGDDPVVECRPPSGGEPERDGIEGIDNVIAHHLGPLALLLEPRLESLLLEGWARGNNSVVIRVEGWNGEDDDPEIDVSFAHSVYGAAPAEDGSAPEVVWDGELATLADGAPALPAWEGDDYFWMRAENFVDGDVEEPVLHADQAWMSSRVLVAELPDDASFIVPLLVGPSGAVNRVQLISGVLFARLSADGRSLEEIVLAGRWASGALLEQVALAGYCPGSVEHDIASSLFDDILDIRVTSGTGGEGVLCDGASFAVRGRATLARAAGTEAVEAPPPACP